MSSIQVFGSGLTVIVDEMPHVESVGMELRIAGGIVADPKGRVGTSLFLPELTARGAGGLSSRELSDAFDGLGARHSESTALDRFVYSASCLRSQLPRVLSLLGSMVLDPLLPDSEVESIRSLLLQDISAVNDSVARRAMYELYQRYFPAPFDRPPVGWKEDVTAIRLDDIRAMYEGLYSPRGAVLSVAGAVRAEEVFNLAGDVFGSWRGELHPRAKCEAFPQRSYHHVASDSAQIQILVAFPIAPVGHQSYYTGLVANTVLSGGMFGRLFIELREKRGLCYSVYSRGYTTNYFGVLLGYVGTTPDRAQQSYDVMIQEFRRLRGSVTEEELRRAKVNLKATVIMSEESSGSRASSNAGDYWSLGRVREVAEIAAAIDRVEARDIDKFCEEFPARDCAVLTLGSTQLEVRDR